MGEFLVIRPSAYSKFHVLPIIKVRKCAKYIYRFTSDPLGGGPFQSGGGPYLRCPLV